MCWAPRQNLLGWELSGTHWGAPEPPHGGAPMQSLQETQEVGWRCRDRLQERCLWRCRPQNQELQASSSSGENLDVLMQHDRSVMATGNRKTHRKQILKHAAFLAS